jgi:esterase/lipase superfamily enzyme
MYAEHPPDEPLAVNLLFGTNRRRVADAVRDQKTFACFTSERTAELTVGTATITIPLAHRRGIVERPWALRVLGSTLFEEDEGPARHFTRAEVSALSRDDFVLRIGELRERSKLFKREA